MDNRTRTDMTTKTITNPVTNKKPDNTTAYRCSQDTIVNNADHRYNNNKLPELNDDLRLMTLTLSLN